MSTDLNDAAPVILGVAAGFATGVACLWLRHWLSSRQAKAPKIGCAPKHHLIAAQSITGDARLKTEEVVFVSRHELAEADLFCPACGSLAAERGDFTRVQSLRIDGHHNEVITCPGFVGDQADRQPCPAILAASPDTEHGDHLRDDGTVDAQGESEPPEFYLFRRVSAERVLQERYGVDVSRASQDAGGGLQIESGAEALPAVPDELSNPTHTIPPEIAAMFNPSHKDKV